ncbi:DUF1206 domain-containing protein [Sulfitobacter sp. F26169L]|uniref:DUF1206 domain-containing protein n=1 Tax=Sulfitobacter sp. F26169L TaxID=2996015 RepID=UPI002260BCEF|nr:DUF1206 domain-containing protein [Sulfitobacter sp. F26169L]MCX7566809.1 DUF1206 domain-containing protein [Sulfitobacter sp. F26169L]
MSISDALSIDPNSTRAKILSKVDPDSFAWTLPIMRAGYAGRGLVYLVVAGLSLWSLWQGGEAEGTGAAMRSMSGSVGALIVTLIAAGMFAYAIWRCIDAIWDLEAHGASAKGVVARIAIAVTGLLHGAIGVLAITSLGFSSNSGSSKQSMLSQIMQTTAGQLAVAMAGAVTIAAGVYYIYKAASQSYRDDIQANHFTLHWNPLLRAGLVAQGVSVAIIGGLILYAALTLDPAQAGGLGSAFDWLREQSYGWFLVIALCLGLLCFSLLCFVNAAYRIVPKATDGSVQNLTARLRKKGKDALRG